MVGEKTDIPVFMQDRSAKHVFSEEEILKDLLTAVFKVIDKTLIPYNLEYLRDEVRGLHVNNNDMVLDLLCLINNAYYCDIEFYSKFSIEQLNKSIAYLCRVFGNQIPPGGKYEEARKVVCINFVRKNTVTDELVPINEYAFIKTIKPNNKLSDLLIFLVIDIDKLQNVEYDDSNKRIMKWLKLLRSLTIEEARIIGRSDKIMAKAVDRLASFFTPGGLEKVIPDSVWLQNVARSEGRDEGRTQGKEEAKMELARTMIEQNYSKREVANVLGISIKKLSSWLL